MRSCAKGMHVVFSDRGNTAKDRLKEKDKRRGRTSNSGRRPADATN